MIPKNHISLHRLILSLSDALDYVCPHIADHQQRVTYIAVNIAVKMGFTDRDLADIFLAAALHDIGMIRMEERMWDGGNASQLTGRHGETGYELLRSNDLFARAARIIRHHHLPWSESKRLTFDDHLVPLASQIVFLADSVERMIDRQIHILEQSAGIVDHITRRAKSDFNPDCVQAFRSVAQSEAFWLDCVFKRIFSLLLQTMDEPPVDATDKTIQGIAEVFARVVDSMSSWTATHTAGVAATAAALAGLMKFSVREQVYMRTAGLLHDLGKLSVPISILDKRGMLSAKDWVTIKGHSYHTYRILETIGFPQQITEWAAFHHERLDGRGYPFRLKSKFLTLGSRIMAIADSFTAIAEDRPYRKGMGIAKVIAALQRQVKNGGLDGDIVAVLAENQEFIDTVRRHEQSRYAESQDRLRAIMSQQDAVSATR